MKTSIRPIRNPDTGETVYHWEIRSGRQIIAGGYGATAEDARSDARNRVLAARNALRSYHAADRHVQADFEAECATALRSVQTAKLSN